MFVKLEVGDIVLNRKVKFIGEIIEIKGNMAVVENGEVKEFHISELTKHSSLSSSNNKEVDTFREQEAVSDFHRAFNYPQASEPTPLSKEQAFKRAVFILEEVIEFVAASCDTPEEMVELVNELTQSHAVEAMNKELVKMENRTDTEGNYSDLHRLVDQSDAMVDILYFAHGTGDGLGVDLLPLFKIAHSSNLSKLDDEGKPIYNEFGKITKSSNFIDPTPLQREEIVRQMEVINNDSR